MADPSDLSWWFGGSTNPQDYQKQTQYADSGQIHDVINRGLNGGDRAAPQVAGYSPYGSMQMQQAQQLQRIASGQQQGAGELAVQRQAAQAQAAQQAAARMARGGNAALAFRQAANNQAGIGLQAAGQSQQAALSDQQAAQSQLTNAMGQARGQDQQIQLANLDAQLRMQGMNDQQRQAYLQALLGMNANQLQAQVGLANNASPGMFPALLQTGGTLAGAAIASDENLKTDITPAGDEVDALMDALVPQRYRYKDEKFGKGERVGIMAQDMLRSKAGADVVFRDDDGLKLDVNKALSAALAATARLNERLRKVEGR